MVSESLREGQARYNQWRRLRAVARVEAYENWLRDGSKTLLIPAIPSDHDYKIARETA